jgi:pyruvate formate lyase activating enzyme
MTPERLRILRRADFIYYDIKIWDSEQHKKYCGVKNEIILQNFHNLLSQNHVSLPRNLGDLHWKTNPSDLPYLIPRIPLIPEITDTPENLQQIGRFWHQLQIKIIDLLPYNPLWLDKMKKLTKQPNYSNQRWMSADHLAKIKTYFTEFIFERFK